MKKLIVIAAFFGLFTTNACAQDVYKEILRMSKDIVKDNNKDINARKIAVFKVDELEYMAMKSRELMPDSTVRMLDQQAFAMYEFVNSYIKNLTNAKKKAEKDLITATYQKASLNNSRFNDMDKDVVLSYCRSENFITKFSLDTDWVKALAEIKEKYDK